MMSYDTGIVSGFYISPTSRTSHATAQPSGRYDTVAQVKLRRVTPSPAARVTFSKLASIWRLETGVSSDIDDIIGHQAYGGIIALGQEAIPLILEDLIKNGPDHWYYALAVISGEDPSENEEDGDLEACCNAWLRWGVGGGYIDKF